MLNGELLFFDSELQYLDAHDKCYVNIEHSCI